MSLAAGSAPELKHRPCCERFLDSTASTAQPYLRQQGAENKQQA